MAVGEITVAACGDAGRLPGGKHHRPTRAALEDRTCAPPAFSRCSSDNTTASVLIIEDEPGICADTKAIWERLIPADPTWQHNERNAGRIMASHLRGQLQGHSLTIPFNDGTMVLGTWQQVVVLDFDTRARTRDVVLQNHW